MHSRALQVAVLSCFAVTAFADIDVYQAQSIEPVKPAEEIRPITPAQTIQQVKAPTTIPVDVAETVKQPLPGRTLEPGRWYERNAPAVQKADPAPPAAPAVQANLANPVEPLSNGLRLTMTQEEIVQKFGPPTDVTWDSRSFGYDNFFVQVGGAKSAIWRATIKKDIRLHSGIGAGSTHDDVKRVFGKDYLLTAGQYRLTIRYGADERVSEIKIEPANGDFAEIAAEKQPTQPAKEPTKKSDVISGKSLAGTWWCIAPSWSSGTIEMKEDGTYTRPLGVSGKYKIEGSEVVFDGNLKAWNDGRARLEKGCLIFEWTNSDGSKNYFAFSR